MNEETNNSLENEVCIFDSKMYNLYKNKGYDFVINGIVAQLKGNSNVKNKLFEYIIFDLNKNGIEVHEQLTMSLLKSYLDGVIKSYEIQDSVNLEKTQMFDTSDANNYAYNDNTNSSNLEKSDSIEVNDQELEQKKENILIQSSIATYAKYKNYHQNDFGTKQLRKALMDKDNNFGYFTNNGERMLREALRRNLSIDEVPTIIKNILMKNDISCSNSNEEMCCEKFINLIDKYYQKVN